jgi:hypothetical protein
MLENRVTLGQNFGVKKKFYQKKPFTSFEAHNLVVAKKKWDTNWSSGYWAMAEIATRENIKRKPKLQVCGLVRQKVYMSNNQGCTQLDRIGSRRETKCERWCPKFQFSENNFQTSHFFIFLTRFGNPVE